MSVGGRPQRDEPEMKKSIFIMSLLLVFVVSVGLAETPAGGFGKIHADDGSLYLEMLAASKAENVYHNGETLMCSDCHTMHASMQHNYAGTSAGEGNISSFPWTTTANPQLLKYSDPLDLCLSCHDGLVGAPDVVNSDINGLAERSGGFFDEPAIVSAHGHDLGRNLPSGGSNLCVRCHWGAPEDKRVTCIDCHSAHGNGNPRNVQWASDPAGTPPFGLFNPAGMTGLTKYERANTGYGTANDITMREQTNMCIDCHHTFSGAYYTDNDGDGIHERHPSYDSERSHTNSIDQGSMRGTTNPAHWDGGVGQGFTGTLRVPFVTNGALDYASSTVVDAGTNGVFCLSCHKAHGSANAFGLVWTVNGGIDNLGCDQCHLGEGR